MRRSTLSPARFLSGEKCRLAHRIIELGTVGTIELAELRVLVAVGMLFPILAPELIEGEIELFVGL